MTTKTQKLNSKKSRIFFSENKQSKQSVETTNQARKMFEWTKVIEI